MTLVSTGTSLSLDEMMRVLEDTENLDERLFKLGDDSVSFVFDPEADDPLVIKINGEKFSLTGESALQALNFAKISKGIVDIYDLEILVPMVNWFYENKDGEMKALIKNNKVIAFCRPGTEIYSNVEILKEIMRAVESHGVTQVYFERIAHDFKETQYCLVIPHLTQSLPNGDVLRAGIQVQNSVVGLKPLVISGYVSKDVTDNGMLSDVATEQWDRRKASLSTNVLDDTSGNYDVYTWAFDTADTAIRYFKKDAASIESLQNLNVGHHAGTFFNDVFTKFDVPVGLRKLVREEYADQLGQTIYDFWNAITLVATRDELDGDVRKQKKMMEVGGKLAGHPESCDECHRLKDEA